MILFVVLSASNLELAVRSQSSNYLEPRCEIIVLQLAAQLRSRRKNRIVFIVKRISRGCPSDRWRQPAILQRVMTLLTVFKERRLPGQLISRATGASKRIARASSKIYGVFTCSRQSFPLDSISLPPPLSLSLYRYLSVSLSRTFFSQAGYLHRDQLPLNFSTTFQVKCEISSFQSSNRLWTFTFAFNLSTPYN